jgi:hypothetical protein
MVVLLLPVADGDVGVGQRPEQAHVDASSRRRPLKDSMKGLRHGSAGGMNSIPLLAPAHSTSAASISSGPLSNRSAARPTPTSGRDLVQFGGEHFAASGRLKCGEVARSRIRPQWSHLFATSSVDRMSEALDLLDPRCPACEQPLRHGRHLSRENATLLAASGNAGITFETQGRCENEACPDFGREFAPAEWLRPTD